MEQNYIIINKNLLFSVSIRAPFFRSGKYKFENRRFSNFLGKTKESLYNYMISNKSDLTTFFKSKRVGNRLLIRKNEDFDFLANDIFSIKNIYDHKHHFSNYINLLSNNLFFTDIGIMTLEKWKKENEELFI